MRGPRCIHPLALLQPTSSLCYSGFRTRPFCAKAFDELIEARLLEAESLSWKQLLLPSSNRLESRRIREAAVGLVPPTKQLQPTLLWLLSRLLNLILSHHPKVFHSN
jgi:hypothetical protein